MTLTYIRPEAVLVTSETAFQAVVIDESLESYDELVEAAQSTVLKKRWVSDTSELSVVFGSKESVFALAERYNNLLQLAFVPPAGL